VAARDLPVVMVAQPDERLANRTVLRCFGRAAFFADFFAVFFDVFFAAFLAME